MSCDLGPDDIKAIRDTHEKVKLIEQTLNGNGKIGLCDDVRRNDKRLTRLEMILAFATGTGIVTGGVFGIEKLIGG